MPFLFSFLCFAFSIFYEVVGQEKPQMMLFQGSVNSTDQCIHMDITNTTLCTISCATNQSCLGFKFEDKTLQNKTGYVWDKDEPSNKDLKQPCIYMMIGGSKIEKKGTLDDIGCLAGSGYFKRAVLCGKKAE
ncbi:hypothetical protein B9Z55_013585 [Caenorhabditis nigoni]|uniref:PAN-3 domain-containing protein n=1 Tax=Caenorhabditis nigoni TaxID=1611254 RepID=A0A2G5U2X3_9PELO|nr:hypothetical protein B9Z55_013585 [Caenorhabditis nigoni]